MTKTVNVSVSLPEALFNQVENLVRQRSISHSALFEAAIEEFVRDNTVITRPDAPLINQGDVYWVQADIPHPHVVVQDNVFNHSRINSVVTCMLTTNIKRLNMPGNVLLEAGEANLPKQSVVEVSKVAAVEKAQLGEYIGTITGQRVAQILSGMRFLQSSFYPR